MKYLTDLSRLLSILIFAVVITGCGSSSSDDDDDSTLGSVTLNLELSSKFSVPAVTADGAGVATVTLNRDTGDLSGSVTVSNLTGAVTAAHIHQAIAGKTGGIIVTLEEDAGNANMLNVPAGTILDTTQMTALLNAEYYFNVHTAANGSGEIRGQILPADYEVMRVELKGENEVPVEVSTSNSGIGYVTVNTTTGAISGNISNTGLDDATAAHIHNNFAGLNGAIVVTLLKDSANAGNWDVPAATVLDATQLADLMAGGNYFNVHTPANGSGEVRGQIEPSDIEVVRANLTGDFEVPAVVSAGSGVGYVTVNKTTSSVIAHAITSGLSDTTAAHLHSGFAGTNGGIVITLEKDTVDTSLFSTQAGEVLDATGMADFLSGKLYFNVHTATNAPGDVRGQIAHSNIRVTRDVLSPAQEVPAVNSPATGVGYTTVNEETGSIEANVRTLGLVATAAHIHEAAAGSNGGIAIPLVNDTSDTDFWSASGTLTADQITAFKADELYFNVHSDANPGGEIRAQINR